MEEVRYVKGKDGWQRIVRTIDDAPKEYKDNYYYRNKQQTMGSEAKIKIEQPRGLGEKEGKEKRNGRILHLLWISAVCFMGLILALCLITCVNPNSPASDLVNAIVKFVICAILKALVWIYNIFYNICCMIFDRICNLGVF